MSHRSRIPRSPYSLFWITAEVLALEMWLTWFSMFVVTKFMGIFEDFGASVHPWTALTFRLSGVFRSPYWIFAGAWIMPILIYRSVDNWCRRAKSPSSATRRLQVIFWLIPYGLMLLTGLMVVGLLVPVFGPSDVVK